MKGSAAAAPVSVYQEKAGGFTQSPNGDGSFKYIPARDAGSDANFHAPGFDVSDWKKISVPSNWELNGFAEPKYALLMPLDDAWPAALTHPTAASEVFRPFYQSYDQ